MYCIALSIVSSHSDGVVQSAIRSLEPDEVARVGGAGHKVINRNYYHNHNIIRIILGYNSRVAFKINDLIVCQLAASTYCTLQEAVAPLLHCYIHR